MEANEAVEQANKARDATEARERFVRGAAVLVGILAALLAIATLAANAASEEVIVNQERATDTWNEYQADSLKRRMDDQNATMLTILAAGGPQQAAAAAEASRLKSEATSHYAPKIAKLSETARDYERERDKATDRHRILQLAEAGFQIGIVLGSIAIVTRLLALV
ncbi:MAG: DUF4337 domain-containing protein, partial [Candidatus Dormibacteraeota bacterium]|nr:DUF4337 domain-containing protein [Candidatus Dormibacteraeota bacterium]